MDDFRAQRAGASTGQALDAYPVELDQVTLARARRTVLSGVTLSIRPGEFVGVFGPNGAGKSTLLHAILGLLRPLAGEVRVFGKHPKRGNPLAGYLPQQRRSVADLGVSGWDFVASALHGERWGMPLIGSAGRSEVAWAIDLVGAGALVRRPLCQLSGGELQRLLLAQSLLGKPRLLLLDEPLSSLDLHFQRTVVELVKQIQRSLGITVLFTAHDVNALLGFMDRVLYLGHGQAAIGAVEGVVNSQVLSRLYDTPVEVLSVSGRILVVSGQGTVEAEAHRHDV